MHIFGQWPCAGAAQFREHVHAFRARQGACKRARKRLKACGAKRGGVATRLFEAISMRRLVFVSFLTMLVAAVGVLQHGPARAQTAVPTVPIDPFGQEVVMPAKTI